MNGPAARILSAIKTYCASTLRITSLPLAMKILSRFAPGASAKIDEPRATPLAQRLFLGTPIFWTCQAAVLI